MAHRLQIDLGMNTAIRQNSLPRTPASRSPAMSPEHLVHLKKLLMEMQSRIVCGNIVKQEIVPQAILPGDGIDLGGRAPKIAPPCLPPLLPLGNLDPKPLRLDRVAPPPRPRRRRLPKTVLLPNLNIAKPAAACGVVQ